MTYLVTVKLSAQSVTVASSIRSASSGRRISSTLPSRLFAHAAEPTTDEIDALVGPATPHFAYQLRARVEELVLDLPEDHEVRRYAEREDGAARPARARVVEGGEGPRVPRDAPGWEEIPSAAPADEPLPPRR